MFKQNKWEQWWDSLSPQMQEYLKKQPVWHDRDMYKALVLGMAIGLVIGAIL
jgi:hypothetical protein